MRYMKGYYIGNDDTMDKNELYHLDIDIHRDRETTQLIDISLHFIKVGNKFFTGVIKYHNREELEKDWKRKENGLYYDEKYGYIYKFK